MTKCSEVYGELRNVQEQSMEFARLEQTRARSDKLKIGQTLPQVEALLGKPHEQILTSDSSNAGEQLWIYFIKQKSLQLSFQNFQLFKIEEL